MSSKHDDLDKLIPQVEEHKKQLRKSTIELNQFTSEIQNLSINIRLKEQLIKGFHPITLVIRNYLIIFVNNLLYYC